MQLSKNDDDLASITTFFDSFEGPFDKKPLDLVWLTSRVVNMYNLRYVTSKVSLKFLSDEDFLVCLGDEKCIEEILSGMLDNAFRLTKPGNSIFVNLSRFEDQGFPFARITVEDNGWGIPPEQLKYIFCDENEKPESRYVRRLIKAGLSLAHVEKLVILHEGGICVDSKVGEGSCYRVALPLMTMRSRKNSE